MVIARRACVAIAAVIAATAVPARAEPPHDAATRAVLVLYNQGKVLLDAGEVRAACAKLEEARRIAPAAINLLLRIGECYARLGRAQTARVAYLEAAAVAAGAGDPRETSAREKARALEARIARLTLFLPEAHDLPGLALHRDGLPVDRADLGAPITLDPGDHRLHLEAPGAVPITIAVTLREGEAQAVTLPRLAPVVAPARPADGGAGKRAIGVALGSVGLVGLTVGAIFGVKAMNDNTASNGGHCDAASRCDDIGFALRTRARREGDVATGAMIGGAAALAGGAIILLVARPGSRDPRAAVTVAPAANGAFLGLRGRF